MLALTHHAIVQFAAFRAGIAGWFRDYAVLGDDIIIGNEDVAKHYLRVMEILGVEIGLAKSLISNNKSGEFANKILPLRRGRHRVTLELVAHVSAIAECMRRNVPMVSPGTDTLIISGNGSIRGGYEEYGPPRVCLGNSS
jgi:hypothetical protein